MSNAGAGSLGEAVGRISIDSSSAVAAIRATVAELGKLKTSALSAGKVLNSVSGDKLAAGLTKVSGSATQVGDSLKRNIASGVLSASAGFDKLDTSATRSSASLGKMVTVLAGVGLAAAAGIGGATIASINLAAGFETSLNRFASVAGESLGAAGLSVEDFKNLALDMGAQTQFSAGQAADALVELVKGGVDPATAAAGGLEAALNLAAAGEISLSNAADISAKQMGVWVDAAATAGERSAFLARSADLLAQAANASTVGVADLAGGLAQVGGSAKVAGLSFDETVQTMALLAPGFASASDAGTSFKAFLSNLTPTTDKQSDAFRTLNLLTEDGKSKFFDATGAFVGMDKVAGLLNTSLKGLSEEQKIMALNAAFGADALRVAALIADQSVDGYNAMGEAMDGAGTAAEQAAKRNKGFAFSMESLKGSMETLAIVIGSGLLPILTSLIQQHLIPGVNAVTEFAKAVIDADDPLATFTRLLDDAAPGLGTALGLVLKLGSGITNNLVPAISALAAGTATFYTVHLVKFIAGLALAEGGLAAAAASAITAASAFALVAIPVALIAGGVFLVSKRMQDVAQATDAATAAYLEHDEALIAINATIAKARESGGDRSAGFQQSIVEIDELREKYVELTDMLLFLEERGGKDPFDEAHDAYVQTQDEIAGVAREMGLVTERMEMQAQAQDRIDKGLTHGTSTWSAYGGQVAEAVTATDGLAESFHQLSEEESKALDKLGKDAIKVYEDVSKSFGGLVDVQTGFLADREQAEQDHADKIADIIAGAGGAQKAATDEAAQDRIAAENAGYAESERAAALSYSRQLAAQRAALGAQLIELTTARAAMLNTDSDLTNDVALNRLQTLVEGIAAAYGVVASETDATLAVATAGIDGYLSDVSVGVDTVVGSLDAAGERARDFNAALAERIETYELEVVDNFGDTTGRLDDFNAKLQEARDQAYLEVKAEFDTKPLDDGIQRFSDLHDRQQEIAPETVANVPTDAQTAVERFQALKDRQAEIASETPANVPTDAQTAIDRFADLKNEQALIKADVPANVTTDVDEARARILIFEAKRAAIPKTTEANLSTNAPAVAGQMYGVRDAVNSIPTSRTVTIKAVVDPALTRHSPSPIEQVMAAIEDFTSRRHVVQVDTAGLDRLTGGFADDPIGLDEGKVRTSVDAVEAHLRRYVDVVRDTASAISQPASELGDKIRTEIEAGIPGLRGATASMVAAIIDGMRPLVPALEKYSGPDLTQAVVASLQSGHIRIGQEGEELARVLMAPIQELRRQGQDVGEDFLTALVTALATGHIEAGQEGEELARAVLVGLGQLPKEAESLGRDTASALVGGFDDQKPMEQIVDKVKSVLGQGIPADAQRSAHEVGGILGQALVKQFKSEIDQGIPGAIAEALSKQERSDKGKGPGGDMGNLGQYVTQGTGRLGGIIAEAAATIGKEAGGAFTGSIADALDLTKPVAVTDMKGFFDALRLEAIDPSLTTNEERMRRGGIDATLKFGEGLLHDKTPLNTAGNELGDAISGGIARGIDAGVPAIRDAAREAAREAFEAAMAQLGGGTKTGPGGKGGGTPPPYTPAPPIIFSSLTTTSPGVLSSGTQQSYATNDNRIIFESGAIVQQPGEDAERFADLVIDKMDRRTRLARTR